MSKTKNVLKRMMHLSLLASLGFVALLLVSAPALAATAPGLGVADSFAVLGASTVTNTGSTVITGDVGLYSGPSITGFAIPPANTVVEGPGSTGLIDGPGLVTGTIYISHAVAQQAQSDVTTAYNALTGQAQACGETISADLGGMVLEPGVYCSDSSMGLTGILTLNALGNPNAVWVFQIGSSLTTASNSSVTFINSGSGPGCNVFWQVGTSATLGTYTAFVGNILALATITLDTGATLAGRALARNGAVTMDTNIITPVVCAGVPPPVAPTLGKVFSPSTINAGGVSTLTITFTNTNTGDATLLANFTDNLPGGMTTVGLPTTTCGGTPPTVTATSVTLPVGATIRGGAPGTCTVTVGVTVATTGSYINTLDAGALYTDLGRSAAIPDVVLIAVAPTAIPTLNEWGMIIFMVLVGLMSIYYLRRQKAKA